MSDGMRQVLVIPDLLAVDKDDFLSASNILLAVGQDHRKLEEFLHRFGTNDADRIRKLTCRVPAMSNLPINAFAGKLEGLTCLSLCFSKIASLPPAIGSLRNLKLLNLRFAENLSRLPETLGNLKNLETINLTGSGITVLPSSLGQLQTLKELNLFCTTNLTKFPNEIGNLSSLKRLYLHRWSRSLLLSLERLWNLEDLSFCYSLPELPREVGHLTTLKHLDLHYSAIKSLPASLENLRDLMYLNIAGTDLEKFGGQDVQDHLLKLVQQLPSLGFLGRGIERRSSKLAYALACNRARSRVRFVENKHGEPELQPCLWPLVLHNAEKAFGSYPSPYLSGDLNYQNVTPKRDAIHQILMGIDGRESFVRLLIDPTAKGVSMIIERS